MITAGRVSSGVSVSMTACTWLRSAANSPLPLRGADGEEVHVGERRGLVVGGGEGQPARVEVAPQYLSQAGFVERHLAGGQLGDLARVDVDAEDLVAEFGQAGRMCRAEISGSEHGASHEPIAMRRG